MKTQASRLLSFLFVSALTCLVVLFFPKKISATELIGTHLGEGDVGSQINIIRNILIPNGLEPGSPVTVMVGINMLQPSQINTVQGLADAVKAGGYFPIVRINDVCDQVDEGSGITPSTAVNAVRSVFGSDALIVYGNEINNRERECNNWSNYVTAYNSIADKTNVSPAALDYYMGLSDYTVETMFSTTPGMSEIYNSAPRAANSYGCVGSSSSDCDPLATTTQQVGYTQINGPVYMTEFSLSPESNSPNAPDTDIKKVIEFIQNRAAETGAVKITPLVRNVCNSESTWLIYVNGKLFTPAGTEVGENCEGGTSGSGYDLSLYPDYDVDETKFYLTPIRSLIAGGTPDRTVDNLRKELALQGYEAYCAAESVKIKPEYDTPGLIDRYVNDLNMPDGIKVLETESVESLSTTNVRYPIWRDVSNKQFLLSSLEEYFGFRDVYSKDPSRAEITSSPINSLLSQPQLCVQGWENLVAQQLSCERLKNPAECELLTRPIPGTDFTVATLLEKLSKFEPLYREGFSKKGCERLFSTKGLDELKQGLINTPTYFDRSYRYGFIVASIRTKDPGTADGTIAEKIFNFFTNTSRSTKPSDEVLVAAFKLPDIGTNKGGGDDSGSQFWSDPTDLTRKVLSTKQEQYYHEVISRPIPGQLNANGSQKTDGQSRTETRINLLGDAVRASKQNDGSKIYCYEGEFPTGTGTTSCQNELPKAIVDIINGTAKGCGDTEAVSVITDIAGLDNPSEPYGKVFNADNGGAVLLNLFFGDKTHDNGTIANPQEAQTDDPAEKLKSLFTISDTTWPAANDSATVSFYIVYPMGFELKEVEEVMKGVFFTQQQIKDMDEAILADGFQLSGQSISLDGGSTGFSYPDPDAGEECGTAPIIDPVTKQVIGQTPLPCTRDVSIQITQESADGMGILGARLGTWLRNIQVALSSKTSEAHKYFTSCKTTEEFLLGKCRGGNFSGGKPGDSDTTHGYDTCGLKLGTGYCAPENLKKYFDEENARLVNMGRPAPFLDTALEADKASRICQRESGSSPYAFNDRCVEGTSVDYSVGLFQINMLPRCEGAFKDGSGVPDTAPNYDPYDLPCTIVDQVRLNECALSKVAIGSRAQARINANIPSGVGRVEIDSPEAVDLKAEENIRYMVKLRREWGNYQPWTAGAASCSIK